MGEKKFVQWYLSYSMRLIIELKELNKKKNYMRHIAKTSDQNRSKQRDHRPNT